MLNRKQRIKIENICIVFGVTQVSILRPLLFNIFLADLLFIIADIVADNIEEASTALFQWFDNNLLKNNPDKCHLLISSNENITVKIGEYEVENSECEE